MQIVYFDQHVIDSVAHNHLFSNHVLHKCETPSFQRENAARGEGFLCQRGIRAGIVWKSQ